MLVLCMCVCLSLSYFLKDAQSALLEFFFTFHFSSGLFWSGLALSLSLSLSLSFFFGPSVTLQWFIFLPSVLFSIRLPSSAVVLIFSSFGFQTKRRRLTEVYFLIYILKFGLFSLVVVATYRTFRVFYLFFSAGTTFALRFCLQSSDFRFRIDCDFAILAVLLPPDSNGANHYFWFFFSFFFDFFDKFILSLSLSVHHFLHLFRIFSIFCQICSSFFLFSLLRLLTLHRPILSFPSSQFSSNFHLCVRPLSVVCVCVSFKIRSSFFFFPCFLGSFCPSPPPLPSDICPTRRLHANHTVDAFGLT